MTPGAAGNHAALRPEWAAAHPPGGKGVPGSGLGDDEEVVDRAGRTLGSGFHDHPPYSGGQGQLVEVAAPVVRQEANNRTERTSVGSEELGTQNQVRLLRITDQPPGPGERRITQRADRRTISYAIRKLDTAHASGTIGEVLDLIVVINDSVWTMYSIGNMLAGTDKPDRAQRSPDPFRVCCSRAQRGLPVVFLNDLPGGAEPTARGWFTSGTAHP
ncbi:hypothetical protein [Streptomyces sp. NPDC058086]|uniref:hypothetical protein n=1 Tax=Streptomyces sp. NPDC058086 TaxID=3346334 RepID=UPI0036F0E8AE